MKFNYQARTEEGEIKAGNIEAINKESAFKILKEKGLYVAFIEEDRASIYSKKIHIGRIKKRDIAVFSRQVAIMFKSRVPLTDIFQTLGSQTKNPKFKEKIFKMLRELEGGASLSDVFSMYPNLFSTFYISMVKSGETSGKLVDIFLYLADYLEKEEGLKKKIIGAMIYPAIIILVFLSVIILSVIFIIPQLTEILEESGEELPILTRIVIGFSNIGRSKWGWGVLILLIALIFAFIKWIRTEKGKELFDKITMKIPILKTFLQKLYLARTALNLSTLISGGLPIAISLEVTANVVNNSVYREILIKTRDGVKQGEPISSTIQRYPKYISPFFYQMVVVGEKTGTMESSLKNVVTFYEEEVDRELATLIKLIEPMLILFLGLIVGVLIAAILIPIYSISMA